VIRRTALGDAHPLTINALAKVGQTQLEVGRHDDARRNLEAAYAALAKDSTANAKPMEGIRQQLARLPKR
jgi:hypothetical protein